MVKRSTHKRYGQNQLTKIFATTSNLPTVDLKDLKYRIWFNPTDDTSLRLSIDGYNFVVQTLKIKPYEFELDQPLSNRNLLQLERYFQSMYYLFRNFKIIVFDEQEASMLTLHGSDLGAYLENLEISS